MRLGLVLMSALVLGAAVPVALRAQQCPDGTPPPCSRARATPSRPAPPSAADRARRYLILPFRNVTRSPEHEWLVEGSTTMLVDALGRWEGVSVVADERLYPALRRAGITPGVVPDLPRVRRVAEETGGWTAVTGDVLATGGRVRISARAWDVVTSRELVRAASEIPASADVRIAYDSVSLRLLRSAGLDTVTPDLSAATTRNLDAYRAYLRGLAHERRSEPQRARTAFAEAVRLDSAFAMAWTRLATATASTNVVSIFDPANVSAGYAARAVALSARLPFRQRQLIQANDAMFRAQFTEARRLLEGLLAADSSDPEVLGALAEIESFDPILVPVPGGQRPRGSPNRAAFLAKRAVEIDPARRENYALLTGLYASAGGAGEATVIGTSRPPQSFADLFQHREALRGFSKVYRDSFALIPAESLSTLPSDSLESGRRAARGVARQWARRWLAAAPDEGAAHLTASSLDELDGEYASALREVTVAESLGVETPTGTPPLRMVLLGEMGRLADAACLADSLGRAGFFGDPSRLLLNISSAVPWAFNLALLSGSVDNAQTLFTQTTATVAAVNLGVEQVPAFAFGALIGTRDPRAEPRIPTALRAQVFDSTLRRTGALAVRPQLGPWVPVLLQRLAQMTDDAKARLPRLLEAAESLAASGQPVLAFQLAANVSYQDSTLEPRVADAPWYRAGADSLAATRIAVLERFHAASATVSAERAVFEWRVDGDAPFRWNRPETPPGRNEFRWIVTVRSPGHVAYLMAARSPRLAGSTPQSGTLAELLARGVERSVEAGPNDSTARAVPGAQLRVEALPGVVRLTVEDADLVRQWRERRPAEARLFFQPCAQTRAALRCADERVPITYP